MIDDSMVVFVVQTELLFEFQKIYDSAILENLKRKRNIEKSFVSGFNKILPMMFDSFDLIQFNFHKAFFEVSFVKLEDALIFTKKFMFLTNHFCFRLIKPQYDYKDKPKKFLVNLYLEK